MNWELWKRISDDQIKVRMEYASKDGNRKYLDFLNEERLIKSIILDIRMAEDQAALIMIQHAEAELKEFTRKVINGEFR